ncbi:hypothetical protein [Melaminivora sp.]|uniref:hypothetical protein n=1 Tax=Melaminivora sp. TaxID=1933032 RepID=UPI0028AEA9F1|nr:hypothetical protein [Melaminivora sp.]
MSHPQRPALPKPAYVHYERGFVHDNECECYKAEQMHAYYDLGRADTAQATPVAYAAFADNGNIRIWSQQPLNAPGVVPLFTRPAPDAENPASPQHPDDAAVDRFAAAMKAKLAAARAKGRGGRNDPERCPTTDLQIDLRKHVHKGDPVDVGNFAMKLHQRSAGTTLPPLSQDLLQAIKSAPPGTSVIEHGGRPIFISREGDDPATLLVGQHDYSELQAQVVKVAYQAGEITLQMFDGAEVPQDLAAGAVVDMLYTSEKDDAGHDQR